MTTNEVTKEDIRGALDELYVDSIEEETDNVFTIKTNNPERDPWVEDSFENLLELGYVVAGVDFEGWFWVRPINIEEREVTRTESVVEFE